MNTTNLPPNPTHTLMTKNGLQERMRTAQSLEELESLRTLSLTYTNACSKTINRWKKIFTQRKSYLLSL